MFYQPIASWGSEFRNTTLDKRYEITNIGEKWCELGCALGNVDVDVDVDSCTLVFVSEKDARFCVQGLFFGCKY